MLVFAEEDHLIAHHTDVLGRKRRFVQCRTARWTQPKLIDHIANFPGSRLPRAEASNGDNLAYKGVNIRSPWGSRLC